MAKKGYIMLYEEMELDLVVDCGQLFSDEDVLGVHLDEGIHLHQ